MENQKIICKLETQTGKLLELTKSDFPLQLSNETKNDGMREYIIYRTHPLLKLVMNTLCILEKK